MGMIFALYKCRFETIDDQMNIIGEGDYVLIDSYNRFGRVKDITNNRVKILCNNDDGISKLLIVNIEQLRKVVFINHVKPNIYIYEPEP